MRAFTSQMPSFSGSLRSSFSIKRDAFRAVLSRKPEEAELAQLRAIFQEAGERYRSDSQAARELIGKRPIPAGATAADWAAWFSVCHVLLNLDETITKG